jgi:hypothetical protein
MPLVSSTDIDWRRAFIRSGVRFADRGEILDLSAETAENRLFIQKVLDCGGWDAYLAGDVFTVPAELLKEHDWLDCWERLHGGAEAGTTGFAGIELEIMDTYLAGVIRWLNALGIRTLTSCDGHRRRAPYIEVAEADVEKTRGLIQWGSQGQVQHEGRYLLLSGPKPLRPTPSDRRWVPPRERWPDRRLFLDIAERLHSRASSQIEKSSD